MREVILHAVGELSEREFDIITHRFPLDGSAPETLQLISKRYGVSRERIRQIEANSLRKISRKKKIVDALVARIDDEKLIEKLFGDLLVIKSDQMSVAAANLTCLERLAIEICYNGIMIFLDNESH